MNGRYAANCRHTPTWLAHNAVGGDMAGAASPTDPLFWLHHAFIDKTWADWQASSNGKNPPSPSTVIKPATMETGVRLA